MVHARASATRVIRSRDSGGSIGAFFVRDVNQTTTMVHGLPHLSPTFGRRGSSSLLPSCVGDGIRCRVRVSNHVLEWLNNVSFTEQG